MRHPNSQRPHAAEVRPRGADAVIAHLTIGAASARGYRRFLALSIPRCGYVVVAFALFLLALLWSAVAYQLSHDRTAVFDAARTNTGNLARAYSEHVADTLRLLDEMLIHIKNDYENSSSNGDLAQQLHNPSNIDAGGRAVEIVDEHGYVAVSTASPPPTVQFVGDRQYFLVHASGDSNQLYISQPLSGRFSKTHPVIVLSRGLKKPNGDFAGVVSIAFDPQYLTGFFSDLAIGKNSSFTVVGRDMTILDLIQGSGRNTEWIGKSLAKSQLALALARAPNGNSEAPGALDGVTRIFSYRSLPEYSLVVNASVTESDLLADFRERKSWLIGVAAALLLIFVAVAVLQLRRLTLQSRSERTLLQTQELLVESQRIAKLGYALHDLPNGHIYWSDSLFEIRGVPRREVFTVDEVWDFSEPDDRAKYLAARQAAFAKGRGFAIDIRMRGPGGSHRWEHWVIHPDFDARGEPIRILVVVQDITERKENEIELAHSRDNMARTQHVAAFGSFERDLANEKHGAWSDEMYRILGLEKGRVTPGYDAILPLVHPDDRERFQAAREAGAAGIAIGALEFRITRPDGAERIIYRENALTFDENHRPVRLYGSYQDVTERRSAEERERQLERKLIHSQKLEALGTLAGGIAHDLNNTLVPVMALSKITARRLAPGSVERANLETIFAASEQARDLVKRVLAFSRQDKIDKKPANLREIVIAALQLLRATIPASIRLDEKISEVPPVLADASQIHQVITNLVSNAAQAIGIGLGAIAVTLDEVSGSAPGGTIRLSVADTGEGMDEATQRRIFEPFFTTKEVGRGTGLGLSIIAGIVADHGGKIEVESAPGKGARFDVYFPPMAAKAAAAA